jgi:hypothetical protein
MHVGAACVRVEICWTQHILDTQHAYGTIEDTLDILHIEKKGPLKNTLERFHIYKLSQENMQLNDTYTDIHNPIFNLITNYYKKIPYQPPTPPFPYIDINTHTTTV